MGGMALFSGRVTAADSDPVDGDGPCALLAKLWAMSSKVLPLVSGTFRKVKMKKRMRSTMKMMKTYGPRSF